MTGARAPRDAGEAEALLNARGGANQHAPRAATLPSLTAGWRARSDPRRWSMGQVCGQNGSESGSA